ncbi:FUSC family protein [Sphingobacterium rhinopitheci]|uniref:FUSC family protein n=1 Tax=Sphingobacterium rhinopitheci TaxID=2781960 RepID=UPI001F516A4E|nr:FUSC family membrane protein [Sphingobacterium rhinopitheci]MCI0922109.1 FUSC family protein [Sphingobacterium rhinopitheci]
MQEKKRKFIDELLYKISDDHFYNAVKITLCAVLSFLIFYDRDGVAVAFGLTLGATLCSPIDSSNSLKEKIIGVGLAAILVPTFSIALTLLYSYTFIFYVVFAIFVFFSALISLYGQRANQMSFTLLLGICLSFIHITNTSDALSNGLYMFCGGMMYLTISIIFYLIRPSKYISIKLAVCINNVASYLQLRSQYWGDNPDIDTIKEKQLALQVVINDSFNQINQYLDYNNFRLVNSKNNRKIILATSFLNEIMEFAISTTFHNKETIEELDKQTNIKKSIAEITQNFATNLKDLSDSIRLRSTYQPTNILTDKLADIQDELKNINDISIENKFYIDNIYDYLSKQIKKIKALERVCTEKIDTSDITLNYEDAAKYFTPNQYRFKTLIENFNFKSIYFRYAMRTTIALLIGLTFGDFIALQKEYWVLLTIIVIIRPGYGLTKSRMHSRVLGTVIGGLLGIVILYFIKDTLILGILTASAMLFSYWFSSKDYRIGVTFTTLFIILIYGILKTGADISVLYRIVDTLTGATIAFVATTFLWPSWETDSVKKNLIASINSTIEYINQFKIIYIQKLRENFEVETTRKNAFIAIGNLMESYQRLIQEPKNKQQNRAELYKIAILNQTLVGAVASLGSFIRSHQENENFQSYDTIVNTVIYNLDVSLSYFGDKSTHVDKNDICPETVISTLQIEQSKKINLLDSSSNEERRKLEESQLMLKQLSWIANLSEQIETTAKNIK